MKEEKEGEEEGASRDGRGELPVKACGSGMNERTGKPNEGRNGQRRTCAPVSLFLPTYTHLPAEHGRIRARQWRFGLTNSNSGGAEGKIVS
ncbi:hypothetical protein G5I_12095 [Acromyrmex echinatior]|uniref:Uncharacterized protein n=1 Tax=Acromyrmex echinatior TaxID=103372 RepID=F4X1G5_ACREC|nr:hypothetical protein G5I_12095 [Acromyrmex echinatior]